MEFFLVVVRYCDLNCLNLNYGIRLFCRNHKHNNLLYMWQKMVILLQSVTRLTLCLRLSNDDLKHEFAMALACYGFSVNI